MHRFSDDLAQRRALQLYRTRRVLESPQGVEVRIGGETLLSFCSNDYLGLANDTRVIEAFRQAALDNGVGSGAFSTTPRRGSGGLSGSAASRRLQGTMSTARRP